MRGEEEEEGGGGESGRKIYAPSPQKVSNGTRAPFRTDTGGCWEAYRLGGDVAPASVRGAVGLGRRAHLGPVRAPAAGADPAAVEPPLEPDPGQREQPAAAEGLHGLAAGRRDLPLALPGELTRLGR